MKLVVDANVLFALSKPSSAANSILSRNRLRLFAPDFALLELHKYKEELVGKSGAGSFGEIIKSLKAKVVFVDNGEYRHLLKKAALSLPDPGDAAYLALALRLFLPVWSNGPHLKQQSLVPVFTTSELVKLMG